MKKYVTIRKRRFSISLTCRTSDHRKRLGAILVLLLPTRELKLVVQETKDKEK